MALPPGDESWESGLDVCAHPDAISRFIQLISSSAVNPKPMPAPQPCPAPFSIGKSVAVLSFGLLLGLPALTVSGAGKKEKPLAPEAAAAFAPLPKEHELASIW